MIAKLTSKIFKTIFFCIGLMLILAFYTNVPTNLTDEDRKTFNSLGFEERMQTLSFEEQIKIIERMQKEIFKRAPLGSGIELYKAREPADLIRTGQGLCYDRSRAFDKGAKFFGMESRHVFLLYKKEKPLYIALLTKEQPSHAVTEIKTAKGWMFVDSNRDWVAITRHGEPVGADDVWRRFDEFESPPEYLKDPWWAIRGLYSRSGHFYEPYVPFPEFNWPIFISWLIRG